jgi:hypothetical protein
MAFDPLRLLDAVDPEAIKPSLLDDNDRKVLAGRARAFRFIAEKSTSIAVGTSETWTATRMLTSRESDWRQHSA